MGAPTGRSPRRVIAALKADPCAKRVAGRIPGANYSTVLRIAKAAAIELPYVRKLTPEQNGRPSAAATAATNHWPTSPAISMFLQA
jgi:hypothetical protein